MEVVTATPTANSPFHNRDVQEWSRLDRLTGVLERARLESDHWTASNSNGTHKYGKLIDSRARTTSDGNHLAQAQRQLEVFQSHHQSGTRTTGTTTSSRLQVIKTQSAAVVSSSSSTNGGRWLQQQQNIAKSSSKTTVSSSSTATSCKDNGTTDGHKDVVLQGFDSLQLALNPLDLSSQKSKASVGRSVGRRPPSRSRLKEDTSTASTTITTAASCSSQHQSAAFRFQATTAATNLHRVSRLCHQIHDTAVKNTFGQTSALLLSEPREDGDGSVEITEVESGSESNKSSLTRTKSTSSEDLHEKTNRSTEDLQDLEQLQNWRRTSKLRRSLQYPNRQQKSSSSRPLDLPETKGNVRKIREDLETGRRLSTALRGNNVDLDALDQILQSISSSSSIQSDLPERDTDLIVAKKTKKSSFVTVESIKDMRSRLRRTSSPDKEDTDDGIVTEELTKPSDLIAAMEGSQSRVRSYVYGMESMLGKGKNISGTGSLESRTKQLNGNAALRNEDWYSRRKSYGFEQVHDKAEDENSIAHKTNNRVESSTDSGICRSSEIVLVPTATKVSCDSNSSESDLELAFNKNRKYNSYTKLDKKETMLDIDENPFSSKKATEELASIWNKRASSLSRDTYNSNSPTSDSSLFPTKLRSDNSNWISSDSERESKSTTTNDDFKHSSYTNNKHSDFTDDDTFTNKRNNKKVEFCKTEVHFVADSGRVNIVETDDKPPPTQNFRRRRRNTGNVSLEDLKKTGVPLLRFGDTTYEKTLFGDPEDAQIDNTSADEGVYESVQLNNEPPVRGGVVTVNINTPHCDYEEDQKENYENGTPRGILKNKPVKPKPYILGDNMLTLSENSTKSWTESPIWRSTVTVRNTFYDKNGTSSDNNDVNSDNERSDYGKLLRKQLRPSNGIADVKRNSENFDVLRGRHSPVDLRRSSWSVADRVKKVEDLQWTENKGYSTKINIGNGEATVVENRHPTWPRRDEVSGEHLYSKLTPERDVTSEPENKATLIAEKAYSTQIIRRPSPLITNQSRSLKSSDYLSSPVLVQPKKENSISHQATDSKYASKITTDKKTATKSVEVLRQPKKSQMAYFGIDVSPTTLRKNKENTVASHPNKLSEKPDLLQFSSKVDSYTSKSYKQNISNKPSNGHIYANLNSVESNKKYHPVKREFDSKILEELTKAADEILQAVNGYTDEERHSRFSTEEEDARKFNPEALETISETKSVHNKPMQHHQKSTTASRLKQASSTSSIDSISRECLSSNHTPRSKLSSVAKSNMDHKYRSKKSPSSISSDTTNKSQTKARRLQRANSREALLQSHGSSSEDLAINVEMPIRKPRLVKRTKTTQLIISNGIEIKKPLSMEKKKEAVRRKPEDRVTMAVPEIRHKTAVSTIRSTAEKVAASKERSKQRYEDGKKKSNNSKREHYKGVSVASPRITGTTTNGSDPRSTRSSAGREYSSAPYRTVLSSNTPFAKKPHKSEGTK